MMEHSNYCAAENGIRICNVSSTLPNCSAENILNAERKVTIVSTNKQLWMSLAGLPQSITLDLTQMQDRPKFIKCFGFDCWHDYQSNPSVIELMVSTDAENFITWITVYPELKQGIQLFQIDPLGRRYQFVKIIIKETFGASKTYLNQVFLLEEYVNISTESVSESHQHTENNNSQYRGELQDQEQHGLQSDKVVDQRQAMEYQDLAMKIESMGREVASLKQSNQVVGSKQQSQQIQQQQQLQQQQLQQLQPIKQQTFQRSVEDTRIFRIDEQIDGTPMLTSTEKMVNGLKKEVAQWKQKSELLESNLQQLQKIITSLVDRQQQQEETIQSIINDNSNNNNNNNNKKQQQQQVQSQTQIQQSNIKMEETMDKKISELNSKFKEQLQEQENKFKHQQGNLVKKFKEILKKQYKNRSSSKSQSRSISLNSSTSSILEEFTRSRRMKSKSKSRHQSKQRQRSQRSPHSKENDRFEQNRVSPKQKKVATLLGKLQEKLQQRARKIEQLNLSQRKTRKRSSLRQSSSSSLSSNY